MTREEAINRIKDHMVVHHIGEYPHIKLKEALDMALSALLPVSREQVEKVWRGKWVPVGDSTFYNKCSKCGKITVGKRLFCSSCGAPMTDKAVEMVMERLEALFGERNDD